VTRGRDQARSESPPLVGEASFPLDNRDRRYSPGNEASPIHGQVTPGRRTRVRIDAVDVFGGFLDEPEWQPALGERRLRLSALGPLSRLVERKVSTALHENIRTDEAIALILDQIDPPDTAGLLFDVGEFDVDEFGETGWSADWRRLDRGATTLRWWWLDDEDALRAIEDLLVVEGPGACVYEDGQGRIVFEGRDYRTVTARCQTAQATYRDLDNGADPWFAQLRYLGRQREVTNVATFEVVTRETQAEAVVWEHEEEIALGPSAAREFVAKAVGPFKEAVAPEAGTDYTLSAGSALVQIDRDSGQRCLVTVTAGPAGATLSGLRLRAKPVTEVRRQTVTNQIDTTASIVAHGRLERELRGRQEIGVNVAQDLVDAVVHLYAEPRAQVEIVVEAPNAAPNDLLASVLARQISDRLAVSDAHLGVDDEVMVERIELDYGRGRLVATLGCEAADGTAYFLFDVGDFDVDSFCF
jgi:hypothetical protein